MLLNLLSDGADEGTRTPNLLITNQLLYQLSYVSARLNFPSLLRYTGPCGESTAEFAVTCDTKKKLNCRGFSSAVLGGYPPPRPLDRSTHP